MNKLALIKSLRESTNCGISDCNRALEENNNNLEKSVLWLRKKGLSSASKKSTRITSEGVISAIIKGGSGVIIEVNSETDFVARNEKFQEFVNNVSLNALEVDNLEDLLNSCYPSSSCDVQEELQNQISIIGENIAIRRVNKIKLESNGVIVKYLHNSLTDNIGKIGVLVALESNGEKGKLQDLGKKLAMHIAATRPESLNIQSLDKNKISKELEILKEQAKSSGKPEKIIEKMVLGRMNKYYQDVVLLEQKFIMDDKISIKELIDSYSKDISSKIAIKGYSLYILGDGIEQKETNFVEEVKSMTKK